MHSESQFRNQYFLPPNFKDPDTHAMYVAFLLDTAYHSTESQIQYLPNLAHQIAHEASPTPWCPSQ